MASALQVYIEYLNKGLNTVEAGFKTVDTSLRKIGQSADALDAKLRRVDQTLAGWQRTAAMLAGAGIGGMGLLAKEGLKVHGMFERINLSLEVMLKSKAEADALMKDMVKFAATTPFSLLDLSNAVNQLKSFRVETANVIPYLRTIGEAAATMKVPIDQAIQAMMNLRSGMFAPRMLVPLGINRELLKEYGVQFNKAGSLVSSGEEAFQAALKSMEDQFGGLFGRVNTTIDGMLNNLGDNITRLLDKIGERMAGRFKEIITYINDQLTRVIDSDRLMGGINRMIDVLMDELEPHLERLMQWFDKLIGYLEQNPQALVDGMRAFVSVLKDLVAVVLTLTAARGLLALLMALTSIAGVLAGGGIAGIAVGALGIGGLIALFNMFRKALGDTGEKGAALTDIMTRLGSSLGNMPTSIDSAITAQSLLRDEFGKNVEVVTKYRNRIQEAIAAFLELRSITPDLQATRLEREAAEALGRELAYAPGGAKRGVMLQQGSPQGASVFMRPGEWDPASGPYYYQGMPVTGYGGTPAWGFSYFEAMGMGHVEQRRREAETQAALAGVGGFGSGDEAKAAFIASLSDKGAYGKATEQGKATVEAITGATKNICVATVASFLRGMGADVPEGTINTSQLESWAQGAGGIKLPYSARADWMAGDLLFSGKPTLKDSPAGHASIISSIRPDGTVIVTDNQGQNRAISLGSDAFAYAMPNQFWAGLGGQGLSADPTFTGLGAALKDRFAAEKAQAKAAQDLVDATNKRVEQMELEAKLTGADKTEEIRDVMAKARIEAYVNQLDRFINSDLLASWMTALEAAIEATDAIKAELEAKAVEAAREQASDAQTQARIALARMRGATAEAGALEGQAYLEDAKQAMSDLANATDAPEDELYQLQAAAFAAVSALASFAASLGAMESTIAQQQAAILEQYASTYMAMIEALQGGPLTGPQSDQFADMFGDQSGRGPGGGGSFYAPRGGGQPTSDFGGGGRWVKTG